jgi:exonuclease SbcD
MPLSFSETADEKGVYVLQFKGKKRMAFEQLMVPTFRRLKTIQGSLEKVQTALDRFAAKTDRLLNPWVELIVESDEFIPQLDQQIRAYAAEMPLEIVKVRIIRKHQPLKVQSPLPPDLDDLDIEEVFRRKCESEGELSPPEMESLLLTFRELQNWMSEQAE